MHPISISLAFLALALLACAAGAQPGVDASASPHLLTRFAADVDPRHPLPEHPNPLLERERWRSLNGMWDYAITDIPADAPGAAATSAPGANHDTPPQLPEAWLTQSICVPFPVESALSGVTRALTPNQALWYRRTFNAAGLIRRSPTGSDGPGEPTRLILHFGAVDNRATIYVNGRKVGEHSGGYDPFSIDITDALAATDPQELIVRVTDPTDTSFQPHGKQNLNPHGIWYTAVSGIWQTVWLEAVPASHITRLSCDVGRELLTVVLSADIALAQSDDTLRYTIRPPGRQPIVVEGTPLATSPITIPDARPWSPSDPALYDITVELIRDAKPIDTVRSYMALRTVELKIAPDGHPRVHLNGQPVFLLGLLDQGWWPDGLYTAPTDEALRSDIEQTLAMGFNCARKHVKVEPARWYYWADRLGLLVLQDMPSGDGFIGPGDPDLTRSPESEANYRREYESMVRNLGSHPSIIAWVPFNEGWGQFKTRETIEWAMTLDPTRLVDGPSGWSDRGTGHLIDAHVYPGPGMLPPVRSMPHTIIRDRASFLGEFGGLGLVVEDHLWKRDGSWGYRSLPDAATLEHDYAVLIERLRPLQARGLAGAIYTQTTDVEIEVNGLMTYDRVPKVPVERLAAINRRAFLPPPVIYDITPTAETATDPAATNRSGGPDATTWRYTTSDPGPDWQSPDFNDASWPAGPAGFGTRGTPGAIVGTTWETPSIWLRRTFALPPDLAAMLQAGEFVHTPTLTLRVHHDEDVEVYLNGTLIHQATDYQTGYIDVPFNPESIALLKPSANLLALHCTQTRGGQYIDAGLSLLIDPAP